MPTWMKQSRWLRTTFMCRRGSSDNWTLFENRAELPRVASCTDCEIETATFVQPRVYTASFAADGKGFSPHHCVGFLFLICIPRPPPPPPPSPCHTTLSHTTLSHTTLSHTTLAYTTLSHTHNIITQHCQTQLLHAQLFHTTSSHTTLTHTHTTLSHATLSHTTLPDTCSEWSLRIV